MRIIIKGKDCTDHIQSLQTEHEISAYFDEVRDSFPVADESKEHWQQRNSELLVGLLYLLTIKKLRNGLLSGAIPSSILNDTDQARLRAGQALSSNIVY